MTRACERALGASDCRASATVNEKVLILDSQSSAVEARGCGTQTGSGWKTAAHVGTRHCYQCACGICLVHRMVPCALVESASLTQMKHVSSTAGNLRPWTSGPCELLWARCATCWPSACAQQRLSRRLKPRLRWSRVLLGARPLCRREQSGSNPRSKATEGRGHSDSWRHSYLLRLLPIVSLLVRLRLDACGNHVYWEVPVPVLDALPDFVG